MTCGMNVIFFWSIRGCSLGAANVFPGTFSIKMTASPPFFAPFAFTVPTIPPAGAVCTLQNERMRPMMMLVNFFMTLLH